MKATFNLYNDTGGRICFVCSNVCLCRKRERGVGAPLVSLKDG